MNPVKIKATMQRGFKYVGGRWMLQPGAGTGSRMNKLRIITYNVWFDKESWKRRYTEIIRLVREADPDVICFQEGNITFTVVSLLVTSRFFSVLLEEEWVKQYYLSDKDNSVTKGYGTILLSKVPPSALTRFHLQSNMHRDLLVADFNV